MYRTTTHSVYVSLTQTRVQKSAQYIGEHKLATKVAVIYDSSDTYSTGIYESFKSEAANQGIEVVAEGAFTADNKTDFSVPLQQAQAAGAELVFLPIYYTEASLIITQANKMGYAPQFFGCDGLDGLIGVENFDTVSGRRRYASDTIRSRCSG